MEVDVMHPVMLSFPSRGGYLRIAFAAHLSSLKIIGLSGANHMGTYWIE